MSIGIHVEKIILNKDLSFSIEKVCSELKSECAQIFTHGPRSQKQTNINVDLMKEICKTYRIYVHQTYMTSWTKSFYHMEEQLRFAETIGASGLVLHLGKISVSDHIDVLQKLNIKDVPVLLEMRALKPGKFVYHTHEELNELCEGLSEAKLSPSKVGLCFDTAHINAGKIPLKTSEQVASYMNGFKKPEYIKLLHLNGNLYNPDVRAGDKHCIPCCNTDFVFSRDEQGHVDIVHWFTSRNLDVILEQPFSTDQATFINDLRKSVNEKV